MVHPVAEHVNLCIAERKDLQSIKRNLLLNLDFLSRSHTM